MSQWQNMNSVFRNSNTGAVDMLRRCYAKTNRFLGNSTPTVKTKSSLAKKRDILALAKCMN